MFYEKNKLIESKNLIRDLISDLNKMKNNHFDKEINFLSDNFLFITPIFLIIEKVLKYKKQNWKKHHKILKKILIDIFNFEISHHDKLFKKFTKKKYFDLLKKEKSLEKKESKILEKEKHCKIDETNLKPNQIKEIKKIGVFLGNIFRSFWNDISSSKEKNIKTKKTELKFAYWFGYHFAALITIKKKHIQQINKKTKLLIPILFFALQYIENLRSLLPIKFNYLVIKVNNLLFKN